MKFVIQKVSEASVHVEGECIGRINRGFLVFVGIGKEDTKEIPVFAVDGVRYTVPQTIRPACMEDTLTLRFRVGAVYRDCYVSVASGTKPGCS